MRRLPMVAGLLGGGMMLLPLLLAQGEKPSPDTAAGKKVFESRCADCHNTDSKEEKTGPGLQGIKEGLLPSGKKATHDNILETVIEGVGDEMPAFGEILSEKQQEDLVAYVMTL